MATNHYFDQNDQIKPYTHSLGANPGSLPPANAVRVAPEMADGFWPCWDGEKWVQIEDHRGQKGWLNGEESTIGNLGPLPAGWSDEPPELTQEEIEAARIEAIKAELIRLDMDSIRPLRAIDSGNDTQEDHAKLSKLELRAATLRTELAEMTEK